MKFGVLVFPGSNCDHDCYHVVKHVVNQSVDFIWHKEKNSLSNYDCIIIPGGFSYGDYLRAGAIAHFSPIMKAVIKFARAGGLVIGICNGFQMLLETGLLPGAMLRNRDLKFICKFVNIRVENNQIPYTVKCSTGQVLQIPIAHMEGSYYADQKTLQQLRENNQIIFRYCDSSGDVGQQDNPNGSLDNIAGICNKEKNVLGMMPHPERCAEAILGCEDGRLIFESIIKSGAK